MSAILLHAVHVWEAVSPGDSDVDDFVKPARIEDSPPAAHLEGLQTVIPLLLHFGPKNGRHD